MLHDIILLLAFGIRRLQKMTAFNLIQISKITCIPTRKDKKEENNNNHNFDRVIESIHWLLCIQNTILTIFIHDSSITVSRNFLMNYKQIRKITIQNRTGIKYLIENNLFY